MKIIDMVGGSLAAIALASVTFQLDSFSAIQASPSRALAAIAAPTSPAPRRIVDPQYGSIQIRFQWFMDIHCHELELNTKSRAKSRRALEACWAKFTRV